VYQNQAEDFIIIHTWLTLKHNTSESLGQGVSICIYNKFTGRHHYTTGSLLRPGSKNNKIMIKIN
jgi:hypothetical protein